ncbi:MMPL family transporter [Nocardioides sp. TRM66260-LWL]|nr:MMPL family transporter [Nocardioides sp. TRM66260-LWL]
MRNLLAQISGRRDAIENTARAEARQRGLSGADAAQAVDRALTAFDRRYGALLTEAMPMGLPVVRNQRFVRSVMFDRAGEPRPEWRFLLPDAKAATILVRPRVGLDQAQTADLIERIRSTVQDARTEGLQTSDPLVSGAPAVTAAMSREATRDAPRVGVIALAAVGSVFLLVPWSRRRRDRLRPLLTAVLGTATVVAAFGLADRSLSLGAVAFLPIVLGIGSDFPLYLSQPGERRRVLVAAGAAVACFASLGISSLPFVREFGLALSAGVVVTAAWALALGRRLPAIEPARSDADRAPTPRWSPGRRAVGGLLVLALAASVAGFVALGRISVQADPQALGRGLPALADADRAERELGFSGEVSLVIRPSGPDAPHALTPASLAWARDAEERIAVEHGDRMRPLLTMAQLLRFLGPEPSSEQVDAGASLVPPYLLDAVLAGDGSAATSTFGVRLDDLRDQDALVRSLRRDLPPPPAGYDVEVVGLPVVAASGLAAVSASRWLIGLLALVMTGGLIALGLRDGRLAAQALSASILASGWVYLGLGVAGVELSPLMLAVGALIAVTSCEFTLMLDAAERERPWLHRSVLTAAGAAVVGYLCLGLSTLAVLRDFGLVLAFGVVASLAAAHLVVLLARPHLRRDRRVALVRSEMPPTERPATRVKETV